MWVTLSPAGTPQKVLPSEKITIHAKGTTALSADKHIFCVEIADEAQEWQMGLMFRRTLKPSSGMLFLYPRSDIHTMWMKNTPLSLDMLFINASGTIIHLAENTTPYSHDIISPPQPIKAVLELNAGTVKRLGIKTGFSIHHHAFGLKQRLSCIP